LEVLQVKERIPTPSSDVFIFEFAFESYKEFGVHQFHNIVHKHEKHEKLDNIE
jgi:hypothetical protein